MAQLGGPLADLPVEPDEGGILRVQRRHFLSVAGNRFEEAIPLGQMDGDGPAITIQEDLHAGEAALHLGDLGDRPDGIEAVGIDLLGVFALAEGEDQFVGTGERRLDCPDGTGATGAYRRGHSGEKHEFPKRKHGKRHAFGHGSGSFQ